MEKSKIIEKVNQLNLGVTAKKILTKLVDIADSDFYSTITQRELANYCGVSIIAIIQQFDRFKRKGYLTIVRDKKYNVYNLKPLMTDNYLKNVNTLKGITGLFQTGDIKLKVENGLITGVSA